MRNTLSFLLVAFCAVCMSSCGPSRHAIHLEMRYPSKSGIELAGKIISVVYLEGKDSVSNSFAASMAEGFAYAMEEEYQTGEGSVGVYRLPNPSGASYSSRDSLFNLLMDTGSDVVFLLDDVTLGEMEIDGATRVGSQMSSDSSFVSMSRLPFSIRLHAFDAMNEQEKVYAFGGSSVARPDVYSDGKASDDVMIQRAYAGLAQEAWDAGGQVADSFRSQWKHEQYSVVYYDSQPWYDALDKASRYDWKGAMDIWFTLLDTSDLLKKSCAEYNIAVACYMLGDAGLAEKWLDRSDADNMLPNLSETLRKRIEARRSLL